MWGTALGVLAASGTTLCGTIIGLEPETILLRALVAGGLVGLGIQLTAAMVIRAVAPHDEE